MSDAELADFEPTTSHRHGCSQDDCDCIHALYAIAQDCEVREAGLNLSTPVEDQTTRLSSAPATDHEHDWIEAGEPWDPQACSGCSEVRR